MKLGIVISSNDAETVWNAFRFANFALNSGDEVRIFLIGKGVECEKIEDEKFNVREQMEIFVNNGGEIYACGTCLKIREMDSACPVSTLKDLYEIVKWSDKLLTF